MYSSGLMIKVKFNEESLKIAKILLKVSFYNTSDDNLSILNFPFEFKLFKGQDEFEQSLSSDTEILNYALFEEFFTFPSAQSIEFKFYSLIDYEKESL
jgi:hypothetical protein